jgi:glutathione S-transferase
MAAEGSLYPLTLRTTPTTCTNHLGSNSYLAGPDFTLADVMSGFAVTTLPALGGRTFEDLPNIQRYAQRLKQRPAWQKAMAIAGPDAQRPAG